MKQKLYLSSLGYFISMVLRCLSFLHKPFMVYGYRNKVSGKFLKMVRISSNAKLVNRENINILDNVWIGHYCLIDGVGGVNIGRGVNIASHSCVYSHSSQNSIRILGEKYMEIPAQQRPAYVLDGVEIGDYTFIGTSCVILPGAKIGKACIVGAGSVVSGIIPDFSVAVGNPVKIIGDTRKIDQDLFRSGIDFQNYYDKSILDNWKE